MTSEKMKPKVWKPGNADAVWKIIICARDIYETEQTISSLVRILTDAGSDRDRGLQALRGMTGDDI